MIKFEIFKAKDSDRNGVYDFGHNLISVGANISNDLYMPDHDLLDEYISLEVMQDFVLVTLLDEDNHFLYQGKRTLKSKKIKKNNSIQFNGVELKLLDFELSAPRTLREELNYITKEVLPKEEQLSKLVIKLKGAISEAS